MPTSEQLRMWLEQVLGFAADAGVSGAGTVVSLGSGSPDITCAFLINLANQKLREIAYATAVEGMSATTAQAYQNILNLRDKIMAACEGVAETPPEEPIEEPTIITPVNPPPSTSDGTAPPLPKPPQPAKPTEQEICCAIHGNELPTIDTSEFDVRRTQDGVSLGGRVIISHPCGIESIEIEMFVIFNDGTKSLIHNRNYWMLKEKQSHNINLGYRRMPIHGAKSGYLWVQATSNCGRAVKVNLSPYGRNQSPSK